MVKTAREVNKVKRAVEQYMQNKGYTVFIGKQSYLDTAQCVIIYDGISIEPETQDSYIEHIDICVEFNVDENDDLPSSVNNIISGATKFVQSSVTNDCTGFYCKDIRLLMAGDTANVQIIFTYYLEIDDYSEME